MFAGSFPCKNIFEIKYHILNYKEKECYFEKNNLKCVYGVFCPDHHKVIKEENIDKEIINFRTIFRRIIKGEFLKIYEIFEKRF
jgi:hypothetical protein